MTAVDPCHWTACEAVQALKDRLITPSHLIDASEQRTVATDQHVTALPAPLRAHHKARQEAAEGLPSTPWYSLAGLPICVKDLTSVAGLPFTEGTMMFKDRIGCVDDPMVAALKAAGALIVSKSNTPEFGAGAQTYNALFGITRNPWNTQLTAGGSSGGSAAALATGQVWGATGTDLGGSLRIPAAFCGVVGLRPSPGLVPQPNRPQALPPACNSLPPGAGVLLSLSGPMARSIPDLCLLLDAMVQGQLPAGFPGHVTPAATTTDTSTDTIPTTTTYADAAGQCAPTSGSFSFLAAVQPEALAASCQHIRCCAYSDDLGLGQSLAPVDPEVAQICRAAARECASLLGVPLVEDVAPDSADCKTLFQVLRGYKSRGLAPICLSKTGMRLIKTELQQEVQRGMAYTDQDVFTAAAAHAAYQSRWATFMSTHQLLMTPTVICPPFDAETTWLRSFRGTQFTHYTDWFILTWAVSLLECPCLSLPVGFTKAGLPVGLQLIAAPKQDAALLAAAAAYEGCHTWSSCVPVKSLGSSISLNS